MVWRVAYFASCHQGMDAKPNQELRKPTAIPDCRVNYRTLALTLTERTENQTARS
jgi:hypothetical protein